MCLSKTSLTLSAWPAMHAPRPLIAESMEVRSGREACQRAAAPTSGLPGLPSGSARLHDLLDGPDERVGIDRLHQHRVDLAAAGARDVLALRVARHHDHGHPGRDLPGRTRDLE